MAGRPREPVDLLIAKGKKHLTKKEIDERRDSELKVPFIDVSPPSYLTAKQKKEFRVIADQLLQLNIMTELDIDVLAQYCIAKDLYLEYSEQIKQVLGNKRTIHKWDVVNAIAADCEEAGQLVDLLEAILKRQRGDDVTVFMNLQDKAFKQCLACAKELGLTITSRCKIVIPSPPEGDDDDL